MWEQVPVAGGVQASGSDLDPSKRRKEQQNLPTFRRAQRAEGVAGGGGLTSVALDCVPHRVAFEIVHEPCARSQAPQRGSAELIPRARATILDDPVSGPDVVEQEVGERVDDLVPERSRHRERSTVDSDRALNPQSGIY